MDVAPARIGRRLRVVAFAGASNWPLWAGVEQGLFRERGLSLELGIVPNSRLMARKLHDGEIDIALTAIDNVVAYVARQGEEDLPHAADFFAFMGVDDGLLSLTVRPDIDDIAGLRGANLGVDALTTGFAFVLRELVGCAGIGAEVNFVSVGNGAERLRGLVEGAQQGTLLNTPLDLIAEEAGMKRLVRASTQLGAYQGIVGAARRSFSKRNGEAMRDFIAGFHASLAWLAEEANAPAAIACLRAHMPGISAAVAAKAYCQLLGGPSGFTRDLAINRVGVATVLALRSRHRGLALSLADADLYIDDSFRAAALASAPRRGRTEQRSSALSK
jgi:ABC-type nitrate/sulfonate/bicarbonate transport system substrate-binding protein